MFDLNGYVSTIGIEVMPLCSAKFLLFSANSAKQSRNGYLSFL